MISPANWEGCESEQKVLAQVFPTSPAFQSEGTNKLRAASRSHRSQCHQRAQKNKGKGARTSHTALPTAPHPAPSPALLGPQETRIPQGTPFAELSALPRPPGPVSVPSASLAVEQEPLSGVTASPPHQGVKPPSLARSFPSPRPLCTFII